jgi:hypothetical protein
MSGTPQHRSPQDTQVDPGESVEPRPAVGAGFDVHTWSIITQIFERLGKIDQKMDHLSDSHAELKKSVEKHDKLISRAIYWTGGAISLLLALWFVYDHFLKDHLTFK